MLGIDPLYGPTAGGTPVKITGVNFTPDSTVDFGVVPGIKPQFKDDKTITVTSPRGVGIVDVTVTNMFGTSSAVIDIDKFIYKSTS